MQKGPSRELTLQFLFVDAHCLCTTLVSSYTVNITFTSWTIGRFRSSAVRVQVSLELVLQVAFPHRPIVALVPEKLASDLNLPYRL